MDEFPEDDTGDVLRSMKAAGDDLSLPRVIDFSVVFPTIDGARTFSRQLAEPNVKIELDPDIRGDGKIDVTVSRKMLPTHEGITDFEHRLAEVSAPFGGENDGWGCFEVRDSK